MSKVKLHEFLIKDRHTSTLWSIAAGKNRKAELYAFHLQWPKSHILGRDDLTLVGPVRHLYHRREKIESTPSSLTSHALLLQTLGRDSSCSALGNAENIALSANSLTSSRTSHAFKLHFLGRDSSSSACAVRNISLYLPPFEVLHASRPARVSL